MRKSYRRRSVIASRLKAFSSFSDTFSLSSGMKNGWKSLSGLWSSNSGNVTSSTDATTYPISYVKMSKSDITASINVSPGTGISFWVTDSGNWYATTYVKDNYTYSCNCSTCYGSCYCNSCKTCSSSSTSCQTCCNVYSCSGAGYSNTIRSGSSCYNRTTGEYQGEALCTSSSNCNCQTTYTYYSCGGYYSCNPYSCNCGSCNATNYFLNLVISANSVISELTSSISLGQSAASIWIQTSGNDITAKAYSDTNKLNQIGTTLSYTAQSPLKTGLAGIIKYPSDDQGSTASNFTISIN